MSRKVIINNTKTSDRRSASGLKATSYLHTNQELKLDDDSSVSKTAGLLKDLKQSAGSKPNPTHFKLFVGNLGQDVDEELLLRSLIRYPSVSHVQVPKDPKKGENKGYGFVSFADSEDYLRCFKEMNGKYIGSKPVELKKAKGKETSTKKHKRGDKKRH
ncbi:hypothetical protein OGAPHI_002325 [Ogataea philodendri]|uniref:RRM domain-containing protein n=1 Tax=Ogataea philodendri TaxID=1378263 RepID=A0A9P8T828_9ASCO|nr:uncharacterized protein OGAPHI_002325 [Ogataea philodendri]KAH3668571.1 hypothetical protein OGAPHI_002325 [Ogataea philodendri]